MATPTTTERRAQGFGAPRFLVRGPDFTSEESLASIRPRITDYPERIALDPQYPAPGRRGGSRLTGVSARPAPLPGSGGGTYPPAIDPTRREKPVVLDPNVADLPAPISTAVAPGGLTLTHYASVPASSTRIIVSPPIPSRFIITDIRGESPHAFAGAFANLGARIKVSHESSTAGGVNTPGYDVQLGETENGVWFFHNQRVYIHPNHFVNHVGWFVKIVAINIGSGIATFYMISVSIKLVE